MALGIGLDGLAGRFTAAKIRGTSFEFMALGIDNDPKYSSGRVRLALTWHPGR